MLLFGREADGLHDRELDLCTHLAYIPTSDIYPAMNLAQSVAIAAYEITRAIDAVAPAPAPRPLCAEEDAEEPQEELADHHTREAMYAHLEESLAAIGFLKDGQVEGMMRRLRRILGRAQLTAGARSGGRFGMGGDFRFGPVLDDAVLPSRPMAAVRDGRGADVPLLLGSTLDEATLLEAGEARDVTEESLREILSLLAGDLTDETIATYRAGRPGAHRGGERGRVCALRPLRAGRARGQGPRDQAVRELAARRRLPAPARSPDAPRAAPPRGPAGR